MKLMKVPPSVMNDHARMLDEAVQGFQSASEQCLLVLLNKLSKAPSVAQHMCFPRSSASRTPWCTGACLRMRAEMRARCAWAAV